MSPRHVACLGAVVGLAIERTILRARSPAFQKPADLWILCAGASAARAEVLADTLISRGTTALISFGIAGGLDPALRPGALLLPREIVLPGGGRLPTDAAWRDKVAAAVRSTPLHDEALAGTDHMLADLDEKREMHHRTQAAAADMESHGVARAAARASVPLLVIRAVADPGDFALPKSAVVGLDATGAVRPSATLAALLSDPRQLGALLGVAANTFAALTALWKFAGEAGASFAPG